MVQCLADYQSDDEVKMSNTVLNASFVNISSVEHKEGPQFSLGYPCGSAGKEYSCNVADLGCSIPGQGRSPGEGKGCPLQYSGLENCMDYIVYGIAKSQT